MEDYDPLVDYIQDSLTEDDIFVHMEWFNQVARTSRSMGYGGGKVFDQNEVKDIGSQSISCWQGNNLDPYIVCFSSKGNPVNQELVYEDGERKVL